MLFSITAFSVVSRRKKELFLYVWEIEDFYFKAEVKFYVHICPMSIFFIRKFFLLLKQLDNTGQEERLDSVLNRRTKGRERRNIVRSSLISVVVHQGRKDCFVHIHHTYIIRPSRVFSFLWQIQTNIHKSLFRKLNFVYSFLCIDHLWIQHQCLR